MVFPSNLRYTAEHEWVALDGNFAIVGITDFAQGELGDIVFVELDCIGKTLGSHEVFGTVEAVKTVSDLYMPLSGKITEVNPLLQTQPELVNQDAYGEGWMIRIQISNPAEWEQLMDAGVYQSHAGH
ncbi:MAG: glycine cleavage system protein GcvH [Sphingomonadales bacterium]|nr:glycine cleavage system protein GcvH [Sphingomonadales bacterium]